MGDNYPSTIISSIISVYSDGGWMRQFCLEYIPLYSLMDGIYMRFLRVTSYVSHQFIRFVEDLVVRDERRRQDTSEISFFEQCKRSGSCVCSIVAEDCFEASASFPPSSNNAVFDRRAMGMSSTSKSSDFYASRDAWNDCLIIRGLVLPLHGLRLGWRLTSSSLRSLSLYLRDSQIQAQSFLSRLQRTLHGSSEDIGWLETTPGFPPVENGTSRFMELLQDIRCGEHSLPNSFIYLLIPGLFSNHSPLYFLNTKKLFSKMGLACHIAKIHSEASVERNAWELKQYIEELYWGSGKRVLILGHSKGGVDAAAALSLYWSDLRDKVAGLALVQSPYGGTPLASDFLREGQVAYKEAWKIMEFVVCKLIKGDMKALVDLTYEKRKDFITKHRLPSDEVPIVSFHTEAAITPGVLATMSQIAHAELPWLPLPRFISEAEAEAESSLKIPVVIPLSAAMALGALHLRLRYGEKSDGLVTRRDAEVPGSVAVRPDRKLDHAWMVYSTRKDGALADASEMCEALLTLLVEIGKRHTHTDET